MSCAQAARRAVKNKALGYLSALDDPAVHADLLERMRSATNMTDQISALAGLADSECERSDAALLLTLTLSDLMDSAVPRICYMADCQWY